MPKIYISPSDQTKNAYAAGNTTEAIQCRRIAVALKLSLMRCGFDALTNVSDTMAERVNESNEWGADLHLCIHTNAYNGKVSGTRIFSADTVGEGYVAANAVFNYLAPLTPGVSENVKPYPALYEIRNTGAPCVYIEVDFHDVDAVALWLIEHTAEIAEAICQGVCDHYGYEYVSANTDEAEAPVTTQPEERYQTIEDVPQWAQAETQELINLGALRGNEHGLDLSEDMLRTMIINLRATKALLAAN